MVDDIELKKILKEYNLTLSRQQRLKLKNSLDYNELKETLSLLKRLSIPPELIEKNPTILYYNHKNINNTLNILKNNNLYNYNQEELIKILSIDEDRIKDIFHYLSSKYGQELINKNILILTIPSERIKSVERYEMLLSKETLLSAMLSKYNDEELYNIVLTCTKLNINITPNIFKHNPNEIREIVKYCTDNYIEINDRVFTKSIKELKKCIKFFVKNDINLNSEIINCPVSKMEKLIDSIKEKTNIIYAVDSNKIRKLFNIYERFNFNINIDMLFINPEHINEILKVCSKHNIFMTESMINRIPVEIEEIIKYCKDKGIKIRDCYFKRTKNELEEIFKNCSLGLKREDSIYNHTYKEIKEIINYCNENNIKIENTMFKQDLNEIKNIIAVCEKRHIEVSSGVYNCNFKNLDRIITILKQQPLVIPYTDLAFNRTPEEVQNIKEIIKTKKINIIPELFLKNPYELNEILKLLKDRPVAPEYFKTSFSKFKDIVKYCEEKEIKITPSMMHRTIGELEDILEKCKYNNIEIMDHIYMRKPDEIDDIINYCKLENVEISIDCFRKNPEQFKEAVNVCRKLGIPAEGEVFKREPEEIKSISKIYDKLLNTNPNNNSFSTTPEEVEKIIELLLDKNIEITDVVFRKKEKELRETIEYIETNYGKEYLLPQAIIRDKNYIDSVFSYLKGRNSLEIIKTTPSILKLSLQEIIERSIYLKQINDDFIKDGKFNPIFSLSKKKYQEIIDKNDKEKQENRRI
ncbi:MAG: hypothetical protein IJ097_00310 [Bacilli bacterium]|nr:hypothetical protein [Bacilli bacterium]